MLLIISIGEVLNLQHDVRFSDISHLQIFFLNFIFRHLIYL